MRIRQLDKALDLLDLFAKDKQPLTLTSIAAELDMPKSSVFNLIDTLSRRGLIYETRQRGGYYPTPRLHEIASAIMEGDVFLLNIHDELERLASDTGETVLLAARQGAEVAYIDVVESASPIRYFARYGERRPLYTTSTGKAILTSYDRAEREKVLSSIEFVRHQETTFTDPARLMAELDVSVERGFTLDRAEFTPDVMGIGVPLVHGTRRFGLAIAGPLYRMDHQRHRLARLLRAAADRMQRIMENADL
ncbi:IclR family transcriptional regulator [Pararhizobium haloflavum]|uniref:IclR family transcriptional regulator n=1 Tax=Pararhizobium haloflavum TaxID=2037914 RepID=UPI000C1A47AA|nr:IclR family transcriptional regulator [Pararhizobium haloflavum]